MIICNDRVYIKVAGQKKHEHTFAKVVKILNPKKIKFRPYLGQEKIVEHRCVLICITSWTLADYTDARRDIPAGRFEIELCDPSWDYVESPEVIIGKYLMVVC